jgi:hypothetical protein
VRRGVDGGNGLEGLVGVQQDLAQRRRGVVVARRQRWEPPLVGLFALHCTGATDEALRRCLLRVFCAGAGAAEGDDTAVVGEEQGGRRDKWSRRHANPMFSSSPAHRPGDANVRQIRIRFTMRFA